MATENQPPQPLTTLRFRALWSVFALAIVLGCGRPPDRAIPPGDSVALAPTPPPLAYLAEWIGRPADAGDVLDSEPLNRRLVALLGDDYAPFRDNLVERDPLAAEGGLLYLVGSCASGTPVRGAAVLVVDPMADRLLLKLRTARDTVTRSWGEGQIPVLPDAVTTTLAEWETWPVARPKPAPKKKPEETKG